MARPLNNQNTIDGVVTSYEYNINKRALAEWAETSIYKIDNMILGRARKTTLLNPEEKLNLLEDYNTTTTNKLSVKGIAEKYRISKSHVYSVLHELENSPNINQGVNWGRKGNVIRLYERIQYAQAACAEGTFNSRNRTPIIDNYNRETENPDENNSVPEELSDDLQIPLDDIIPVDEQVPVEATETPPMIPRVGQNPEQVGTMTLEEEREIRRRQQDYEERILNLEDGLANLSGQIGDLRDSNAIYQEDIDKLYEERGIQTEKLKWYKRIIIGGGIIALAALAGLGIYSYNKQGKLEKQIDYASRQTNVERERSDKLQNRVLYLEEQLREPKITIEPVEPLLKVPKLTPKPVADVEKIVDLLKLQPAPTAIPTPVVEAKPTPTSMPAPTDEVILTPNKVEETKIKFELAGPLLKVPEEPKITIEPVEPLLKVPEEPKIVRFVGPGSQAMRLYLLQKGELEPRR